MLINTERPNSVEEVWGQDTCKRFLVNLVEGVVSGQFTIPHTYCFFGPRGTGKAQPLTSKILTPNGWVEMGEIKVGDLVTSENGVPVSVTGVFPQGNKEVFRVTFYDGKTAECCGEHLWKVYSNMDETKVDRSYKWSVKSLHEIAKKLPKLNKSRHYIYTPLFSPDLTRSETQLSLPLPPYILGALLGDGNFTNSSIKISGSDKEILDSVMSNLPDEYDLTKCGKSRPYDYCIRIKEDKRKGVISSKPTRKGMRHNSIFSKIDEMNLTGLRAWEKFIPKIYLNAPYSQRMELLRGLMDTVGTIDSRGAMSFTTTSERLARDVQELVWSIGGICRKTERFPHYRYKGEIKRGRKAYTLSIRVSCPNDCFSLQSKKSLAKGSNQYSETLKNRILSIESIGFAECQCISVNNESKLYVTDDYIVTHNTTFARILAMMLNCKEGITAKPCLKCTACTSILNQTAPSVRELDAASNNGVDDIREIRTAANFASISEFRYKVYIIDEVQALTPNAWQAFLKTLEEPPKNTIFIMCTTDVQKVPEAAFSRCLRMQCNKLTPEEIFGKLKITCERHKVQFEESALHIISKTARGGMRDALAELERAIVIAGKDCLTEAIACQLTGSFDVATLSHWTVALLQNNMAEVIRRSTELERNGVAPASVLDGFISYLYAIYSYQILKDEVAFSGYPKSQYQFMTGMAAHLSNKGLCEAMDVMSQAYKTLPFNPNPKLYLDVAIHRAAERYHEVAQQTT